MYHNHLDTGRKLNEHKMLRRRLLNVMYDQFTCPRGKHQKYDFHTSSSVAVFVWNKVLYSTLHFYNNFHPFTPTLHLPLLKCALRLIRAQCGSDVFAFKII